MQRRRTILLVAVIGAGVAIAATPMAGRRDAIAPDAAAQHRYDEDLTRLDSAIAALGRAAATHDRGATRAALLATRVAYKRVEYLAEHYTPVTARAMNGPPVPSADDENPRVVLPPTGMQVIAAALDADGDADGDAELVTREIARLRVSARRLRETAHTVTITDAQRFDAARLEIARVTTLGIAGADAPDDAAVVVEAAAALDGVGRALADYGTGTPARRALDERLGAATAYLASRDAAHPLDRWTFVADHANAVARAIAALRDAVGVPVPTDRRAFSPRAATVFDRGAFDPQAFAPPDAPEPTPALVALGRALFHEPALSGAGDRSCATCHDPARAFVDGRPRAVVVGGSAPNAVRNTPTLLGAALQPRVLADGSLAFLEDQVARVIASPVEMGGHLDSAAARLRTRGYGEVAPRTIRFALAAYVRTLGSADAPFDRAMRGDGAPLAEPARRGFDLFMGKARCGTCHFAPLFGGAVPPTFDESEAEVIGVPSAPVWRGARVDPDLGMGAADGAPLHAHAFRTPSLREVARTAPYMHNGVYRTLDDVVELYDRGGGAGIGVRLPNATLPATRLELTAREKRDLVAFLRTLSSDTPAQSTASVANGAVSAR